MKITTDKALMFSWGLLIIYSIICEIQIFMDKVPDSTLTGCFFLAFGVAEGGYCAYIHKLKKGSEKNGTERINDDVSDGI